MSVQDRLEYARDLKTEREFLQSKGVTKGFLSGATFGATENIDALKPEEGELGETFGKITGSLMPISKIFGVFGGGFGYLAGKSPILQRQASAVANLFAAGSTGATVNALESVAKGEMPDTNEMLDHGAEWFKLDLLLSSLGLVGTFGKFLINKVRSSGVPKKEILKKVASVIEESNINPSKTEEIAEKAFETVESIPNAEINASKDIMKTSAESELEVASNEIAQSKIKPNEAVTPKQLEQGRVSKESFEKLESETIHLPEKLQPEELNFSKQAEEIENATLKKTIDEVSPVKQTEQELGNSIKEDINKNLKAEKSKYKPLYKEAEEAAEISTHTPTKTGKEAGEALIKIEGIKTKPEGYSKVISTLETTLEDSGYKIIRDSKGKIEHIISTGEVGVSETIKLAKRLNEIIDYSAIEPSAKDALRKVVKGAKQDVRAGLSTNPDALAAFELAEEAHAITARKFGKKSIKSIRKNEVGERIAKSVDQPTNLSDLKEVLTENQMAKVEKQVLEKLNSQSYSQAKKQFREIEKHLSEKSKNIAKEIVESKNPYNPKTRTKLAQQGIIDDMSTALTEGTRPEKTLKLWKTEKGQKLVEKTFKGNENWNEIKSYLENQSFTDVAKTVLKDGKLDVNKLNEFMKNPANIKNIEDIGGKEAVKFFKDLESRVDVFRKNAKLLEGKVGRESLERQVREFKNSSGARGKKTLERMSEKLKPMQKSKAVGEESISRKARGDKESTGKRGKDILDRMAEKDFPVQKGMQKFSEAFTETMGINEKGVMSVFGLMKLGLPNTVASLIGYKVLRKMLINPRVRRAFIEASKVKYRTIDFMVAIENLNKTLEEEGE